MNPPQHSDAENLRAERRSRILIADDEETIADTLRMIFRQEGFDVVAVYGGEPAVRMAQQWRPDLFLSDVLMPDLSGIEAAIRITALIPDCRVILTSGKAIVEDLMHDVWQRGYDFEIALKPMHPAELLQLVRWKLKTG